MKTDRDRAYVVGRGKPPRHTRWKKGQTGNPGRIRKGKSLNPAAIVEKALQRHITITEGGMRRRGTAFEAIAIQLWTKAVKGNRRALQTLLRYQNFAAARGGFGGVKIVFEGGE